MPPCQGESERSSSQTRSATGLPRSTPRRFPSSHEDLEVGPRLARRLERLANALDAALARGDGPVVLAPGGGGRQDDVGHLAGPRQEHVLDDEVVEASRAGAIARVWSASDCAGFSPMT